MLLCLIRVVKWFCLILECSRFVGRKASLRPRFGSGYIFISIYIYIFLFISIYCWCSSTTFRGNAGCVSECFCSSLLDSWALFVIRRLFLLCSLLILELSLVFLCSILANCYHNILNFVIELGLPILLLSVYLQLTTL